MCRMIWNMKVSNKEYLAIILECKTELREINQDHLINFSQK